MNKPLTSPPPPPFLIEDYDLAQCPVLQIPVILEAEALLNLVNSTQHAALHTSSKLHIFTSSWNLDLLCNLP